MKKPTIQEIDGSLESMQRIVGGDIEAVYPFDDPVALVCHGEGKLLGLPMNRALTDESGVPYDIVCGTFFVVGMLPMQRKYSVFLYRIVKQHYNHLAYLLFF